MAARITPRLIELTYEAALKSFWRKQALRTFLRACHVSDGFIAKWAPDESKRDLLDKVFPELQRADRGNALIFEMARHLPGNRQRGSRVIVASGCCSFTLNVEPLSGDICIER